MVQEVNYELIKDALVDAAIYAGKIIKEFSGKMDYSSKGNVDFVTEIDQKIEKIIHKTLTSQFPQFQFYGEESYVPGKTKLTDDPTFVVDPIDGTTNFIHGSPFSCTSLGFVVNKIPVIGVIYNPHLDELYTAIKGKGAYLNGKRIPITHKPLSLRTSLMAIEWGVERHGNNFDVKTKTFKNLAHGKGDAKPMVHGFRSTGSAAMNVVHVATGLVDGYWQAGCWAWDICAGWIILEETGGKVFGANPGEWDVSVDRRAYLFVRGGTHEEQTAFIEDVWDNVGGEVHYDV